MGPTDVIEIELDDTERFVLRWGLIDWGGPARCTEEMAVAMGFRDVSDLFPASDRLTAAIATGAGLSRLDWARALLATEICFASDVLGSGLDWQATSGLSETDTLTTLRRIQRKLSGVLRVVGDGLGTLPRREPPPAAASGCQRVSVTRR
jgi:hypothetical protein